MARNSNLRSHTGLHLLQRKTLNTHDINIWLEINYTSYGM